MLPGSTRVWDRSTQQWLDCDTSICPKADIVARANISNTLGPYTSVVVNRCLYAGGGSRVMALNGIADAVQVEMAAGMVTALWTYIIDNQDDVGYSPAERSMPLLIPQLDASDVSRWLAAGYAYSDVMAYLAAVNSVTNHPNLLMELK